jgi:hypothetical protein
MPTMALVNGRWIPARRYKAPRELTLWERMTFWREPPLVSQETANREYTAEIARTPEHEESEK